MYDLQQAKASLYTRDPYNPAPEMQCTQPIWLGALCYQ